MMNVETKTTVTAVQRFMTASVLLGLSCTSIQAQTDEDNDAVPIDRTVLPLREPYRTPITTLDARDAKAPPLFKVVAPKGAPNVVIIMIDDLGFGGTSPFGGPIETPTIARLAADGLRYNQFHSTALSSSPDRQEDVRCRCS